MNELLEAVEQYLIPTDRVQLTSEVLGRSQFEVRKGLFNRQAVAVKLIPFTSVASSHQSSALQQLKKEVLAMKECESQWVVNLFGVCFFDSQIGIVMELMQNSLAPFTYGDLRGVISARTLPIALQVTEGLAFLHSKGFVHRDVKPENILVNADATVCKWTDFGLAHALLTSVVHTRTFAGAGTPQFMAPERIDPSGVVTRSSDIWSLGCVLKSLFTGETPWPIEWDHINLVMAVCVHHKTPEIPASLDERLKAILSRCLQYDPKDRPTAAEVVDMLRALVPTSSTGTPAGGVITGQRSGQVSGEVNSSLPVSIPQFATVQELRSYRKNVEQDPLPERSYEVFTEEERLKQFRLIGISEENYEFKYGHKWNEKLDVDHGNNTAATIKMAPVKEIDTSLPSGVLTKTTIPSKEEIELLASILKTVRKATGVISDTPYEAGIRMWTVTD